MDLNQILQVIMGVLGFIHDNPIIGSIWVALFGGALTLGGLVAQWWRKSSYKVALEGGEETLGNLSGLRLGKFIDSTVKDTELNKELKSNLSRVPEQFDKGWDRGLVGLKIGTIEYNEYQEKK